MSVTNSDEVRTSGIVKNVNTHTWTQEQAFSDKYPVLVLRGELYQHSYPDQKVPLGLDPIMGASRGGIGVSIDSRGIESNPICRKGHGDCS